MRPQHHAHCKWQHQPHRAPPVAVALAILLLAALLPVSPALAADCSVPGAHPTIQAAIDDANCSRILLANTSYAEPIEIARSLEILGTETGTSTIEGPIDVANGANVDLVDLLVTGCADAKIHATGGAQITGEGLVVETPTSPPCFPLFYDGFESGSAGGWSSTSP